MPAALSIDPSMKFALQPPEDVSAWLTTLPAADRDLLTNWYAEWYRTMPVEPRLPFFRYLSLADSTPRTTPFYELSFLRALVQPFEWLRGEWIFKFALDHVSTGQELELIFEAATVSRSSTLSVQDYLDTLPIGGTTEDIFNRLMLLDEDRIATIPSVRGMDDESVDAEERQDVLSTAYEEAGRYWKSVPEVRQTILDHPEVKSWLARISKNEKAVAKALYADHAKRIAEPDYPEGLRDYSAGTLQQFFIEVARRDTEASKRPKLDRLANYAIGHSAERAPRATYLGILEGAHSHASPVFIQYAFDYLPTPDDLYGVIQDGKSLDFSYLDMEDYAAVRKAALKKGQGAEAVLASLRRRATTCKNKSTGYPWKEPVVAHNANKERVFIWERRELFRQYAL